MNNKFLKMVVQKKSITVIILIYISIRILIPMINGYIKLLGVCFDKQYTVAEIYNFFDCIKAVHDNKIIGLIYVIIALISIFSTYNILFTKKRMKVEKEGINFKQKDGTHGTANFAEAEEIDILKIGDEQETPGIVLGKTLDTDEIIVLPDSSKSINRNVMVWGASGAGKSTSYIIPNALKIAEQENEEHKEKLKQLALEGKNVVFTDPKGELYGITSKYFEEQGYDVKVFNLVNPEHSDGIDLFKFIEKEIDAQVFAQVVISTTQNAGKKGEEFWQNTQENLLKALLLHIRFEVDDENKKNMRYLNSILASRRYKEN